MSAEKSTRDTARAAATAAGIEITDIHTRTKFILGFTHAVEGKHALVSFAGFAYREDFAAGRMDLRAQAYIAETAQFISLRAAA